MACCMYTVVIHSHGNPVTILAEHSTFLACFTFSSSEIDTMHAVCCTQMSSSALPGDYALCRAAARSVRHSSRCAGLALSGYRLAAQPLRWSAASVQRLIGCSSAQVLWPSPTLTFALFSATQALCRYSFLRSFQRPSQSPFQPLFDPLSSPCFGPCWTYSSANKCFG